MDPLKYFTNKIILIFFVLRKFWFFSTRKWRKSIELLNNLIKNGLDRKDITEVIYSHFHQDHFGWTSIDENGKIYSNKNDLIFIRLFPHQIELL